MAAGAEPGAWGPAASAPVRRLGIAVRFDQTPDVSGAVSAGTLGSIVEIFSDPDAGMVGNPAGLLPTARTGDAKAVRRSSPLHVRPFVSGGRLLGPLVPVAFLNPPALHRTAALICQENASAHEPARIREGVDHGSIYDARTLLDAPGRVHQAVAQRAVAVATGLPLRVRTRIATMVSKRLPASGTGRSPAALEK